MYKVYTMISSGPEEMLHSISHFNICFTVAGWFCLLRLLGRALEVLEKVYEPSLLQEVTAVTGSFFDFCWTPWPPVIHDPDARALWVPIRWCCSCSRCRMMPRCCKLKQKQISKLQSLAHMKWVRVAQNDENGALGSLECLHGFQIYESYPKGPGLVFSVDCDDLLYAKTTFGER